MRNLARSIADLKALSHCNREGWTPGGSDLEQWREAFSVVERAVENLPALLDACANVADTIQGGDKLDTLEPWAKEMVTMLRKAAADCAA